MLFFEYNFFVLFGVFYICYWRLSAAKRPLLILLVSYIFYAAWDWRFLSLLLISTVNDFWCAKKIEATADPLRRKRFLFLSILINLGMLGFFKYFDFFSETFAKVFGISPESTILLNVILPAGISFYTFQTLSYVIDVYRREIPAEHNLIDFAAFVAFFPQLIAGPIERAGHLLTQIKAECGFDFGNLAAGGRLFLFGLFKKLVIADNLGRFVDPVFADPAAADPLTLLLAAYCFAFQIYCDFSGYTDMARGLAKSIGIDLAINFNLPYFANSIRDFWQRWHITLYSWFRDYIYKPLGGSRQGVWMTYRNVMIVFVLSGLWHGAGWNFIIWGALHGAFICIERLFAKGPVGAGFAKLPSVLRMILVFHLVTFTWIVFRTPDLATFTEYMSGLLDLRLHSLMPSMEVFQMDHRAVTMPTLGGSTSAAIYAMVVGMLCIPLVVAQIIVRRSGTDRPERALAIEYQFGLYVLVFFSLLWLKSDEIQQFIYFQF